MGAFIFLKLHKHIPQQQILQFLSLNLFSNKHYFRISSLSIPILILTNGKTRPCFLKNIALPWIGFKVNKIDIFIVFSILKPH